MRLPFKGLYIFNQDYGVNPDNYKQFLVLYPDGVRRSMKGHNGLDFACPHRTEVVAPHGGVIKEALFDKEGYGWYVKIENEEEGSVIAHLDAIDVRLGYQLAEGDHIGWSDSTGNSTGPHVHWGYYIFPRDRSNGLAGFIDQKPFLEVAGVHLLLGKLPVVDTLKGDVVVIDDNTSTYKGLDLSNLESVKAAVDAWFDVAHGKYKPVEEFQGLETQLEQVKTQLEDTQKGDVNVSSDLKNYNEMKALGYNSLDDIAKALKTKDDTNIALQTENAKVRERNSQLATMVQKIEEEDHTTAELGQKALDENAELKEAMLQVGKVAGVDKITTQNIVSRVFNLKDLAEKFIKKVDEEQEKRNAPKDVQPPLPKADNIQPAKTDSINWLMKIFQLIPGEGVK
jgi:hypothetical protein